MHSLLCVLVLSLTRLIEYLASLNNTNGTNLAVPYVPDVTGDRNSNIMDGNNFAVSYGNTDGTNPTVACGTDITGDSGTTDLAGDRGTDLPGDRDLSMAQVANPTSSMALPSEAIEDSNATSNSTTVTRRKRKPSFDLGASVEGSRVRNPPQPFPSMVPTLTKSKHGEKPVSRGGPRRGQGRG